MTMTPGNGDSGTGDAGSPVLRHHTIRHDGVTIALSRGGRGRPLLLCPGLLSTQADLRAVTELLRHNFTVTTFDLRGHGRSAAADRYRFEDFLGDLDAVVASLDATPVLVGHSLGADLAVHYAARNPTGVAGLLLVDGANPLPEPFITEADLPEFRAMAAAMQSMMESSTVEHRIRLTPEDVIDLNLEIDVVRADILDRFRRIDVPVRVIASTAIAGDGDDDATRRRNANWRAGFDRLVRDRPDITVTWLDAGHGLFVSHATEVAAIARDLFGAEG